MQTTSENHIRLMPGTNVCVREVQAWRGHVPEGWRVLEIAMNKRQGTPEYRVIKVEVSDDVGIRKAKTPRVSR